MYILCVCAPSFGGTCKQRCGWFQLRTPSTFPAFAFWGQLHVVRSRSLAESRGSCLCGRFASRTALMDWHIGDHHMFTPKPSGAAHALDSFRFSLCSDGQCILQLAQCSRSAGPPQTLLPQDDGSLGSTGAGHQPDLHKRKAPSLDW